MKYLIVFVLILSGCGESFYERNVRLNQEAETSRQNSLSPNQKIYEQAAQHGYNSGKNATGSFNQFQKDIELYVNNPYYKSGWDDGFQKGKAEGENMNAIIRDSVR